MSLREIRKRAGYYWKLKGRPMLNEKRIAELRVVPDGGALDLDWQDALDTLEKLWKVYRAARRWTKATPGAPSIEAEQAMVDALSAVLEDSDELSEVRPTN